MAWYHKFPWTNFHELNLDWILDICGKAEKAIPVIDEAISRADTAADSANSAADLANNNAVAASDAATRANMAAWKIDPVTATATTVYGTGASVTVRDTNPGMALDFRIPAGERGEPGPAGGAGDLIGNGNFTNPVNQRGRTSYDGTGSKMYTIDRWFTTSSATGAVVVGNRYITVAAGATISQIIPASADGSFPSDTDVGYTAVARETNGTLHVANSNITDSKLSFDIGEANSGITVTLGGGRWEYCALYKGVFTRDNVPGYVAKEYVTQLADCMRYYVDIGILEFAARTRWVFFDGYFNYAFPMRITPTISVKNPASGTDNAMGMFANGNFNTDFTDFIIDSDVSRFNISSASAGNLTEGASYKGYFTASADM